MWDSYKSGKKDKKDDFAGTSMATRCYESHPVLKLSKGYLCGGSASHPAYTDADIYVALQSGSTSGRASDPWAEQRVTEVHFSISDMRAPTDVARFKKMVTWLCNQLQEGKAVHVGCIGGHGRSGLVLSAIVAELEEKKDAIQWVRQNYCKKAVESKEQVQFLMKHYGVETAIPTKEGGSSGGSVKWSQKSFGDKDYLKIDNTPLDPFTGKTKLVATNKHKVVKQILPEGVNGRTKSFASMGTSSRSLWRRRG